MGTYILKNAENSMLKTEELYEIQGGAISINATFLNSFARCIEAILDLGRTVGSAIRHVKSKNICPL